LDFTIKKKDENYLTKKILALEKSQRSGHVCYPKITTSNGMSYGKRTRQRYVNCFGPYIIKP
jgi:hypothetical protein